MQIVYPARLFVLRCFFSTSREFSLSSSFRHSRTRVAPRRCNSAAFRQNIDPRERIDSLSLCTHTHTHTRESLNIVVACDAGTLGFIAVPNRRTTCLFNLIRRHRQKAFQGYSPLNEREEKRWSKCFCLFFFFYRGLIEAHEEEREMKE